MNGLLSATPSPSTIRLVIGGFLLLLVQAGLGLLAPGDAQDDLRAVTRLVLLLASACLAGALAGIPDPPPVRRCRHGR